MFKTQIMICEKELTNILYNNKESKINNKTYMMLCEELKDYIKVSEMLQLIEIGETTHYKYRQNDKLVPYSVKVHLYLLLQTIKL